MNSLTPVERARLRAAYDALGEDSLRQELPVDPTTLYRLLAGIRCQTGTVALARQALRRLHVAA